MWSFGTDGTASLTTLEEVYQTLMLKMTLKVTIDSSHRGGRPYVACRKPAGRYDRQRGSLYVFKHKTQYPLIRDQYTCILVFIHISYIPHKFRRVKFVIIPPYFVLQQYLWKIALQPSVNCYNVWGHLCCSGCSLLGENHCEMGLLQQQANELVPLTNRYSVAWFMIYLILWQ